MAYNADLATATSMAPQLGTLSSTTTPTSTQATVIWTRAFERVQSALLAEGISSSVTASSVAAGWVQRAEMLLTSGEVLLAKGSVGVGAESTAPQLIKLGEEMLGLLSDNRTRLMLIDNGGAAATGSEDPRVGSHWTRAKDPEWDSDPGGPDVPYAANPIFPDRSDL